MLTKLKEFIFGKDVTAVEKSTTSKSQAEEKEVDEATVFFFKTASDTDDGITTFGEKLKKYSDESSKE